jgi:hypothetical protein
VRRLVACLLSLLLLAASAPTAGAATVVGFDDTAVTVPMVDGVTLAPKGTASVTPLGGGGEGGALVQLNLTNLAAGQSYHVIAYCTVGPLDGCLPRNYIPQLVDYVHELGTVKADARGHLKTSFLVEGLPDGEYGWHVVVSLPGLERYAVVLANVGKHVHNDAPHEAAFDVALTAGSICNLTRQYVDKAGIANSLCAKLRAADAAGARGQDTPHDNVLDAYVQEVAAQSGKSIRPARAAVLTRLALALQDAPASAERAKGPRAPKPSHAGPKASRAS